MTTIDIEPYRAFWQKRAKATLPPEMYPQRENGRAEANRLAKILVEEFGVERVYLFGSYAWGITLRPNSDLDLAVVGLEGAKFWRAYGRLEKATTYAFDLVELDGLPHYLHSRILESEILLYDGSKSFTV